MKTTKKQCEITGVNAGMYRRAIKHWGRERKRRGLSLEAIAPKSQVMASVVSVSYVASLPPPPSDPADYHCMTFWYQCYMQASYLDGYRNQVAQIQQQITYGEINLVAYLESYASCLGGIPV